MTDHCRGYLQARRAQIATFGLVREAHPTRFEPVDNASAPLFVAVRCGHLRLLEPTGDRATLDIEGGHWVWLPAGVLLHAEARPGEDASFVAELVCLESVSRLGKPRPHTALPTSAQSLSPDVEEALNHARRAAARPDLPDEIVRQRCEELLIWAQTSGFTSAHRGGHHFESRVRALIVAEPSRRWRAEAVASSLGMSGATLRRRLARSGTSFSALLSEVRLNEALRMLEAGGASVTEIAFAVGYNSSSRFTTAFRERFKATPSEVRAKARSEQKQFPI